MGFIHEKKSKRLTENSDSLLSKACRVLNWDYEGVKDKIRRQALSEKEKKQLREAINGVIIVQKLIR